MNENIKHPEQKEQVITVDNKEKKEILGSYTEVNAVCERGAHAH